MWPSRLICDVLDEMRSSVKTLRFDTFPGLIEEVQTLGNRMESALQDIKNLDQLKDEIHDLKREKKRLTREVKDLKYEKEDLEDENS